jgi:hypothetical protein
VENTRTMVSKTHTKRSPSEHTLLIPRDQKIGKPTRTAERKKGKKKDNKKYWKKNRKNGNKREKRNMVDQVFCCFK